ncbi:hypothetical protein [Microbulbifer taiwanensis]|uniref:Uncharacterized protein n=1 Tax=Microbulbifer taiwanensis TaxID=986746 RepID=A0ABW1YGP9_9GAMM|nr:hypothetical protein [Microbulbifer taiwanensis]
MSGQEKFQVVSAGKTLRAKAPEAVLQDAAKAFSIPLVQARRLMVKGWVIKDQLSSTQVVEYRTRLQKIGLRVEVFPAGKYDNRALIAKMQFAQKRRARTQGAAPPMTEAAEKKRAPVKEVAESSPPPMPSASRARVQLEALFADKPISLRETAAEKLRLALGLIPAMLVPGWFFALGCFCVYAAGGALWQIAEAATVGDLAPSTIARNLVSILLAGFVAALLVWPYFATRRLVPAAQGSRPLTQADAQGFYLMLQVLAEKTGLPRTERITVSTGAEVVAEPGLSGVFRQQLPLNIGLAAVRTLNGNELLALAARALGIYRGRLGGVTALLVLDTARRLQVMQGALENERNIVAPSGEPGALQRPFHTVFIYCGRGLLPLVDRLYEFHRSLTGAIARRLERRGDAWVAQLLGSDDFAQFAEKWHQLVHAELVVAEINREASVAGQHLQDYPAAVQWMHCNLDRETRSNLELAMAQASDAWDCAQAADNERIAWAEELALQPLLQRAFSAQKLFGDLSALSIGLSAAIGGEGARAVENRRLLCASREAEQAAQLLGEYFNQLPPRHMLPLELPANEDLRAMDLQAAIDWLRGKLVELRELEQRCDNLFARGAAIQLGAALVRNHDKIQPQAYFLSGTTPAAADESARDNRVRRVELQQQARQIFCGFYLRIERALETMPTVERQAGQKCLEQLSAYDLLSPRLEKLDNYADILGLMIDRLSLDEGQGELVQKYFALAGRELEGIFSEVDASEVLRRLGLDSALQDRVDRAPVPKLPKQRQGIIDALQVMELKCKSASAAIGEHYRIQLSRLLDACLKQERALKIRPLRLMKSGVSGG